MVPLGPPDWLVLPFPLQVKLVTPAGSASLTEMLVAVLGPVLVTSMVAVVVVPGTTLLGWSVLVTLMSYCGVKGSASVAVLLPVLVSLAAATVAVLARVP